jgi:predicted nuclease of predicted toxin-antitoxin system
MTILLDHCMPQHYEQLLQDWGYRINTVRERLDVRAVDSDVIQLA